jgi:hypothetical protein
MAVAVAADLQRVDPIHLVAGRHQRAHEQAPVGLGPHHHLGRVGDQASQQPVQDGQPAQALRHPPRRNHPPVLGHDGHIMMLLSPIEPDEQHPSSLGSTARSSQREPATP